MWFRLTGQQHFFLLESDKRMSDEEPQGRLHFNPSSRQTAGRAPPPTRRAEKTQELGSVDPRRNFQFCVCALASDVFTLPNVERGDTRTRREVKHLKAEQRWKLKRSAPPSTPNGDFKHFNLQPKQPNGSFPTLAIAKLLRSQMVGVVVVGGGKGGSSCGQKGRGTPTRDLRHV